jgi:hypothetical protein
MVKSSGPRTPSPHAFRPVCCTSADTVPHQPKRPEFNAYSVTGKACALAVTHPTTDPDVPPRL